MNSNQTLPVYVVSVTLHAVFCINVRNRDEKVPIKHIKSRQTASSYIIQLVIFSLTKRLRHFFQSYLSLTAII